MRNPRSGMHVQSQFHSVLAADVDDFLTQRRRAQRRAKSIAKWGIPTVYSIETQRTAEDNVQNADDRLRGDEAEFSSFRACDASFGTTSAVTGAFGLALGGYAVNFLASGSSVAYVSREPKEREGDRAERLIHSD
jgi:tRNA A37 threonylcarbamoyladenosine dehydratase